MDISLSTFSTDNIRIAKADKHCSVVGILRTWPSSLAFLDMSTLCVYECLCFWAITRGKSYTIWMLYPPFIHQFAVNSFKQPLQSTACHTVAGSSCDDEHWRWRYFNLTRTFAWLRAKNVTGYFFALTSPEIGAEKWWIHTIDANLRRFSANDVNYCDSAFTNGCLSFFWFVWMSVKWQHESKSRTELTWGHVECAKVSLPQAVAPKISIRTARTRLRQRNKLHKMLSPPYPPCTACALLLSAVRACPGSPSTMSRLGKLMRLLWSTMRHTIIHKIFQQRIIWTLRCWNALPFATI